MDAYHPIIAGMLTVNYAVTFVIWYVVYGLFAYVFTYEGTRSGVLLPIAALADDLFLQLPGQKAAFIRAQVDRALKSGFSGGYLGGRLDEDWSYQNVRDNDLYAKVGAEMLPGKIYTFVVTAPLLYPVYVWAGKSFFPV